MRLRAVLLVLMLVLSGAAEAADDVEMMRTVLERYRTILLREECPQSETIQTYLQTQTPEGAWSDIDYVDPSLAGWRPEIHLIRLEELALYWAIKGDEDPLAIQALQTALKGVRNWVEHRYLCSNKWYNEACTPRRMCKAAVIIGEALSGDLRSGALEVIAQHRTMDLPLWRTDLTVHYACLSGDSSLANQAFAQFWNDVTLDAESGIQSDGSFYHPGNHLRTFDEVLVEAAVQVAWQTRGTAWEIPPEKRRILSHYLINGPMWMCRGTTITPAGLDLTVARKDIMKYRGDFRRTVQLWIDVDPDIRLKLEKYLAWQNGDTQALSGFRFFPKGDLVVYHRSEASVFLKLLSSRTQPTSSINGENLKGPSYLACGDHYILRDGGEYTDLQPVWRWEQLPGLTLGQIPSRPLRRDLVHGLGNGRSGLAIMDYARQADDETKTQSLAVKKMWAFHDDLVICLMTGWQISEPTGMITTSLEQCRWRDEVRISRANSAPPQSLPEGVYDFTDVNWVLHHGIGYMPLGTKHMRLMLQPQQGRWFDINSSRYSPDEPPVSERVFSVLLDHGAQPESCGYVLMLSAYAGKLDGLIQQPSWEIVRNDSTCQYIRFADGTTMAACYEPQTIGSFKMNIPCLALWDDTSKHLLELRL